LKEKKEESRDLSRKKQHLWRREMLACREGKRKKKGKNLSVLNFLSSAERIEGRSCDSWARGEKGKKEKLSLMQFSPLGGPCLSSPIA